MSEEKSRVLEEQRRAVIEALALTQDPKKILSFLQRVAILEVADGKFVLGYPNDFVFSQIKKFFVESLVGVFREQFGTETVIEWRLTPELQDASNPALPPLKKWLAKFEKSVEKTWEKVSENSEKKTAIPENVTKKFAEKFGILLDPKFGFENLVVGPQNALAVTIGQAIAGQPGELHNPFFVYGPVGLGKTHLLQAIGNEICKKFPEKVVLYLPCNKLIDEIITAIRSSKLDALIRKFDDVDVLMVDDVQFLAKKETTQDIFHNIFNDFQGKKKQIVFSSDRPPRELTNIAPRLQSRFGYGVIADIQPPDYEIRRAILQAKLEARDAKLSEEILDLVASAVAESVRELEGALNSLLLQQSLLGELDAGKAREILENLGFSAENANSGVGLGTRRAKNAVENFENLVEMVAKFYDVAVADLKSAKRDAPVTRARQVLMTLAKRYFGRTFERIGEFFGGKNHAGVMYAVKNTEKKLAEDAQLAKDFAVFEGWLE